jgi:hypothetical protein
MLVARQDARNTIMAYKVVSLLRHGNGCSQWQQRCGQGCDQHFRKLAAEDTIVNGVGRMSAKEEVVASLELVSWN